MTAPHINLTGQDPRAATDAHRSDGPLARTDGAWVVLGHEEARAVAHDPETFSSQVSRFLQVPNGLDGEEHRAMREALDPYFAAEEMQRFAPAVREVARTLIAELLAPAENTSTPAAADVDTSASAAPDGIGVECDAVADVGAPFAVRGQTRWLGWPAALEHELLTWMEENHAASRSGNLTRTTEVAERFDAIIRSVVAPRQTAGDAAPDDVTTRLVRQRVSTPDGGERALREEEIVSILRNWTGGDLGSIALCVGVVLTGLAHAPQLADRIRRGSYEESVAIVDELLRIDDPFVSNRRITTCPVTLAGQDIPAGERIILHWTSANRDERVFSDPDRIDPQTHAAHNLVWGTGPHACPGRPLAMLELVTLLQELLAVADVAPAQQRGEREIAPVGGWRSAPVRLTRR